MNSKIHIHGGKVSISQEVKMCLTDFRTFKKVQPWWDKRHEFIGDGNREIYYIKRAALITSSQAILSGNTSLIGREYAIKLVPYGSYKYGESRDKDVVIVPASCDLPGESSTLTILEAYERHTVPPEVGLFSLPRVLVKIGDNLYTLEEKEKFLPYDPSWDVVYPLAIHKDWSTLGRASYSEYYLPGGGYFSWEGETLGNSELLISPPSIALINLIKDYPESACARSLYKRYVLDGEKEEYRVPFLLHENVVRYYNEVYEYEISSNSLFKFVFALTQFVAYKREKIFLNTKSEIYEYLKRTNPNLATAFRAAWLGDYTPLKKYFNLERLLDESEVEVKRTTYITKFCVKQRGER